MNTVPTFESMLSPAVAQRIPQQAVSFAILGAYPPSQCGAARFADLLSDALVLRGSDVGVVRVADSASSSPNARVIGELVNDSRPSLAACAELLNQSDVALIQHQDGIYGGVHGADLLEVIATLEVPSVVVLHTVLKAPEPHQRWVLERIAATADRIVVMSEAARERLCRDYAVERTKVTTISYGGTVPAGPRLKRGSRPVLLTWGFLRPGKGVERVIDAMSSLRDVPGWPRYMVVGPTHPVTLSTDGETYRDARIAQAQRAGVADSVDFDDRSYCRSALTTLIQSASAVVLPYDSTDQDTSAILVDALVSGRPVVATAFPHAVELLQGGAGIVVDHDDPDAMASALRRVLTKPRLAGAMAAEARRLAPTMAWSAVADSYVQLGRRVLAERRARLQRSSSLEAPAIPD